jgi:nicotinamidase/pyrazinamidase
LDQNKVDQIVLKGTGYDDPGYSAFDATNISLPDYLGEQNVGSLYVVGLATDYCVRASALDASRIGFHTYVVTDAIAAVDLEDGDGRKALNEMYKAGCILIESKKV